MVVLHSCTTGISNLSLSLSLSLPIPLSLPPSFPPAPRPPSVPPSSTLPVVPSWILAVIIGLFSGYKFHSLGPSVVGSISYSITFIMYALMITSGLIVHCLFLVECGAGAANAVSTSIVLCGLRLHCRRVKRSSKLVLHVKCMWRVTHLEC